MSKCPECERGASKNRILLSVSRVGGGTNRRPSRRYDSSICVECAEFLISKYDERKESGSGAYGHLIGGSRFVAHSIKRALEQHKTDLVVALARPN